jgi:hypothetical protein
VLKQTTDTLSDCIKRNLLFFTGLKRKFVSMIRSEECGSTVRECVKCVQVPFCSRLWTAWERNSGTHCMMNSKHLAWHKLLVKYILWSYFLPVRVCQVTLEWARHRLALIKKNSVAWVRERTIPTERPPLVGEVSANFCGEKVPERRMMHIIMIFILIYHRYKPVDSINLLGC